MKSRLLNHILFFLILFTIAGCDKPRKKVDLLILGPTIYSMNKDSSIYTAMVVENGKITALGNEKDFSKKYTSDNIQHLPGKFIYPGLIDAHSHFFGLGQGLMNVDLRNSTSEEEMIQRVKDFYSPEKMSNIKEKPTSIQGRGWDQNLWESKKFPSNEKLNELFPHIPVCLKRIDGHAALVNQRALEIAGINE